MMSEETDPAWFISTYCGGPFPHREAVLSTLQTRAYRTFYGGPDPSDPRPSLTCEHYARTFRIRADMMERRVEASPERDGLLQDMRHLHHTLSETPDAPCHLYLCFTSSGYYALYCRPQTADIGACLLLHERADSPESS